VPDPDYQKQTPAGGPAASDTTRSAYTVEGAGRRLGGIGRTTVYELIAAGKLEAVKLGSRTLITAASIEALLANLPRVARRPEPQRDGTPR
jgi:excisionase family DNA binding protein